MILRKEIPLKEWLTDRAAERGISYYGAWDRYFKAKTEKAPKLRRVNSRVVYVVMEDER